MEKNQNETKSEQKVETEMVQNSSNEPHQHSNEEGMDKKLNDESDEEANWSNCDLIGHSDDEQIKRDRISDERVKQYEKQRRKEELLRMAQNDKLKKMYGVAPFMPFDETKDIPLIKEMSHVLRREYFQCQSLMIRTKNFGFKLEDKMKFDRLNGETDVGQLFRFIHSNHGSITIRLLLMADFAKFIVSVVHQFWEWVDCDLKIKEMLDLFTLDQYNNLHKKEGVDFDGDNFVAVNHRWHYKLHPHF